MFVMDAILLGVTFAADLLVVVVVLLSVTFATDMLKVAFLLGDALATNTLVGAICGSIPPNTIKPQDPFATAMVFCITLGLV